MRSHLADARDRRSREVRRRLGRTGPRPHDGRPVNAKQTIVLVHGAYAESSSWNSVIRPLAAEGHRVIAWANPLRSVAGDAAALSDLVRSPVPPAVLRRPAPGGGDADVGHPASDHRGRVG